jgi:chaperonin GroEL (HSP60 family)
MLGCYEETNLFQLLFFCLAAMKTRITNAKIACLDINLSKQRMHLGVHITIDDPDQLEAIRARCVLTGLCVAAMADIIMIALQRIGNYA